MKILKLFTYLLIAGATAMAVTACSKSDDDEPRTSGTGSGSSSAMTINGKKIGKIYSAECTGKSWSEDLGGGKTTTFYLQFDLNDNMTVFSVTWSANRSRLGPGMDLLEDSEIETMELRSMFSIEPTAEYDDFSGRVIVKAITDSSIQLEYEDFSFSKISHGQSYEINGTVSYPLK